MTGKNESDLAPNEDGTLTDVALVSNLNESMPALFDDDALRNIGDFASALDAFGDTLPESAAEYGTGFTVCEDKRQLLAVPFVILQWRFSEGDYGVFVSAAIVTEDGRKLILNDGSTGIREQLQSVTRYRMKEGRPDTRAGLLCKDGLRISEYEYVDPSDGKTKPAATFYIAQ